MEDFLRNNSERFQMRPSDKVWNAIQNDLKRRRRRIGWFTALFLLGSSAGAWMLTHPAANPGDTEGLARLQGGSGLRPSAGTSARPGTGPANTTISSNPAVMNSQVVSPADESIAKNNMGTSGAVVVAMNGAVRATDAARPGSHGYRHQPAAGIQASGRGQHSTSLQVNGNNADPGTNAGTATGSVADAARSAIDLEGNPDEQLLTEASLEAPVPATKPAIAAAAVPEPAAQPAPVPQLAGARRLSLQFFFTPTVSYRSLSENKDYTAAVPQNAAAPNAAALYNINDVVTHKPNIGLELGLSAKVPLSRILRVQGGLQFNMSRYDVQAFDNAQPQPATMAFIGGGAQTSQTNYSNLEGSSNKKDWLQNTYLQVSAPIGFELRLAGNGNTQFGIASTIQPTYILSDRVYLLSTDYKSYAEAPLLVRRWNVNTALSTFIGYSTGKLSWQIGPQVRYQMLSSFVDKYPVKENLFDFGLRVGVSLNPKR